MEQIRTLTEMLEIASKVGPIKVSVAAADDADVLEAVEGARQRGICNAILVGDAERIKTEGSKVGLDPANYEIIDVHGGPAAASLTAVEQVSSGRAQILMKGMVQTADFLRAVLNKEKGLRTGRPLSHTFIHEIENYDRLIFITDAAFNTYPDIKARLGIINNIVEVCHMYGIEKPKIACITAVEVVNPDMPATVDAASLTQMNRRGQIKGCIIDGPLALDNAVSVRSAEHKGIVSEVAGHADVLHVDDIETGNALTKSIVYFARAKTAGIVLGAKVPVVLTSRADSPESKMNSIACAVTLSHRVRHS